MTKSASSSSQLVTLDRAVALVAPPFTENEARSEIIAALNERRLALKWPSETTEFQSHRTQFVSHLNGPIPAAAALVFWVADAKGLAFLNGNYINWKSGSITTHLDGKDVNRCIPLVASEDVRRLFNLPTLLPRASKRLSDTYRVPPGRRPVKFDQTVEQMKVFLNEGGKLKGLKGKELAAQFGVCRYTAWNARIAVLSDLEIHDK
jgi:hypothetical protein